MPIAFNYAARSDVGMVRTNNEDSGYAGPHLLALPGLGIALEPERLLGHNRPAALDPCLPAH